MAKIFLLRELFGDKGYEDGFSGEWKVSMLGKGGMGRRQVGAAGGGRVSIARCATSVARRLLRAADTPSHVARTRPTRARRLHCMTRDTKEHILAVT